MTRGFLCHGCNTSEGLDTEHPLWRSYRSLPPTAILGLRIRYTGWPSLPPPPAGAPADSAADDIARYLGRGGEA